MRCTRCVNQYLHCAGGQPIRIWGSAVHRAYNMFRNSAPNVSCSKHRVATQLRDITGAQTKTSEWHMKRVSHDTAEPPQTCTRIPSSAPPYRAGHAYVQYINGGK